MRRGVPRVVQAGLLGLGLALAVAAVAVERPRADPAGPLRAEIAARWGLTVLSTDLDRAIAPRVARPTMPVHLADLPSAQQPMALAVVRDALSVYPPDFVRRILREVVLAGDITVWGETTGGLYGGPMIAVNFRGIDDPASRGFDVDTVHHELSSIVRRQVSFDVTAWEAANPPGFHYMDASGYRATLADAGSVEGDEALHRAGFVSRYGQTTLDNDWNTYAERVFGHGEDLARVIATSAPMRAKTQMLLDIYLSLDPSFAAYFDRAGLIAATR